MKTQKFLQVSLLVLAGMSAQLFASDPALKVEKGNLQAAAALKASAVKPEVSAMSSSTVAPVAAENKAEVTALSSELGSSASSNGNGSATSSLGAMPAELEKSAASTTSSAKPADVKTSVAPAPEVKKDTPEVKKDTVSAVPVAEAKPRPVAATSAPVAPAKPIAQPVSKPAEKKSEGFFEGIFNWFGGLFGGSKAASSDAKTVKPTLDIEDLGDEAGTRLPTPTKEDIAKRASK